MTMQDTNPDLSLESEVKALRAELAELRADVQAAKASSAPAGGSSGGSELVTDQLTDRRQMLRRAGVGAAAAVAGGAALALTQASPAAAANGGNVILGAVNTETNPGGNTEIRQSGTPSATWSSFMVQDNTLSLDLFPSMVGGIATTSQIHGVYGRSDDAGFGVVARGNGATASGLLATVGATGKANIRLNANGPVPQSRNTNGAFTQGDIVEDLNGDMWLCVSPGATGAAAGWRKLAGPATAGALHVLPVPIRVYDSRPGTLPATGPTKARFNDHDTLILDAKNNSSNVPAGATAVLINATATNTNPGGYFTFWKNGVAWPGTSSLNWGVANTTVATTTVTAVDATALFQARMEGVGGSDLIIDVIGFYR